ncbi:hypothetical protein ATO8_00040 [Roseivivax marinus]|uniref:Uncharacterized protein n=1 Tax=Roseivivax marinus TaxID=1379903 RepID=W4HQ55_9RHOB|nr:hypothetical protein [Roseivivax marinus]ETW14251.1 hypothetical protein ATO8_00040 [Roseivivax marinus]
MTFQLNARSAAELAAERVAQTRAALTAMIDAHVEAVARSRDYNDAAALAGYANSTVPEWAAEAQAFVSWRDQVWLTAFGMLAEVEAGTRAIPTASEILEALPDITWPAE